jgi:hypothetical protein
MVQSPCFGIQLNDCRIIDVETVVGCPDFHGMRHRRMWGAIEVSDLSGVASLNRTTFIFQSARTTTTPFIQLALRVDRFAIASAPQKITRSIHGPRITAVQKPTWCRNVQPDLEQPGMKQQRTGSVGPT